MFTDDGIKAESALTTAGGGPAVPFKLIEVTPADEDVNDVAAKRRRSVRPLPWDRVYVTADGKSFSEWLRERTSSGTCQ